MLRDKDTGRGDFIFQTDRLATIVIEKAMELIPFKPVSVETPVGVVAEGKVIAAPCVCGVSILRSGGPLEKGLQRVIRDVRLGCLLIQSDPVSGEPLLLYSTLPSCVREREKSADTWVFLLDAQVRRSQVLSESQNLRFSVLDCHRRGGFYGEWIIV